MQETLCPVPLTLKVDCIRIYLLTVGRKCKKWRSGIGKESMFHYQESKIIRWLRRRFTVIWENRLINSFFLFNYLELNMYVDTRYRLS